MKAVLTNVWLPLGELQGRAFFPVENEAFYPVRAKVWPDFLFLLETVRFGRRVPS